MNTRLVLAAVAALSLGPAAFADDIRVPQDQLSLESAAGVANPGDRIVLRRGNHAGGVVVMDGVTITGRGATVRGDVLIAGAANSVEGVTFKQGSLTIDGDSATVERCRFKDAWVQLVGNDGTITRTRIVRPGSPEDGAGASIVGDRGEIRSVRASRLERGAMLRIVGDGAIIAQCRVRSVFRTATADTVAIEVEGDDASIRSNVVRRCSIGINLTGARFSVESNVLAVRGSPGTPKGDVDSIGMVVIPTGTPGPEDPDNVVRVNRVQVERGAGIRVLGTGSTDVTENRIRGRVAPVMAIFVQADDNTILENVAVARRGVVQSAVVGDRNVVRDNALRQLSISGDDNVDEGNADL